MATACRTKAQWPFVSHQPAHGRKYVSEQAGTEHPDETWQDEAVVDYVLADTGRARAVELDGREVAGIGRQDVVAVAGGRKGDT